ncbi:hypothetical protein Tco_1384417 [Tanacetum coccineum]
MGFGELWRSWIRACLQSARTSILVNGCTTPEFSLERGLRQGDPLSHFLFILVMEGLHLALEAEVHSHHIKGVTVGNPSLNLSHFFFTDDEAWEFNMYLCSKLRNPSSTPLKDSELDSSGEVLMGIIRWLEFDGKMFLLLLNKEDWVLETGLGNGEDVWTLDALKHSSTRSHIDHLVLPSLASTTTWNSCLLRKITFSSPVKWHPSDSLGNSGGILCIWEATIFKKENITISDNFIAIYGTWLSNNAKILFVVVYAPQQASKKKGVVPLLQTLTAQERFDSFILTSGLVDIKLEGYTFTWSQPSATKMSKLDVFPNHRPILLREVNVDFGPTPFRFFNSWFNIVGFDEMIQASWHSFSHSDRNAMIPPLSTSRNRNHKLLNINDMESKEYIQKSKVTWVIEGDENSKFFHGIINKKRSQLAIRGLSINIHKSQLLGVGVPHQVVQQVASSIGCSIMQKQFRYLGVTIGDRMSRNKAWENVIDKLRSRLSKWKVKTLSIGGRLTLLKSVLGASPIYSMSIFKVPRGVLKIIEAIRSRFFNGYRKKERLIITWIA